MWRSLLISAVFCICVVAQPPGPAAHVITGLTLPARCSPASGDIYNIPAVGFYRCGSANTWTLISTGAATVSSFNTRVGAIVLSSTDVISAFSTCSGTQYLGADGSCHNAAAGGVTSINADATAAQVIAGTSNQLTVTSSGGTTTLAFPVSGVTLPAGSSATSTFTVGNLLSNGSVTAAASSPIGFNGRTLLSTAADGNLELSNQLLGDFGLLQLGGVTASFPAIKRNAAAIDFRLADDSAYAAINALSVSTGIGGGVAGKLDLSSGTLPSSFPANSFSLYAPASIVSSYRWRLPAADAAGVIASDGGTTPGILSIIPTTGTGNIIRASAAGGTPGSPNLSLQFDNNGAFGGTGTTWDSTYIGPLLFTGPGLNDMTYSGSYVGGAGGPAAVYVFINTTGTPDTFKWAICNPTCVNSADTPITGAAQLLAQGISVTFGATTGHSGNEEWDAGLGRLQVIGTLDLGNLFNETLPQVGAGRPGGGVVQTINVGGRLLASYVNGTAGNCLKWDAIGAGLADTGAPCAAALPTDAPGALTDDGLGGFSWQPSGQTPCTFATLGTIIPTSGGSCICSDCDLTSGSNNTCVSGTGPAVATLIGSVNTCVQ